MLLALLIISVIFIVMMPTFKDGGTSALFGTESIDKKSVETRVDQQVNEIEKIRKQNAEQLNEIEQEY